MLQQEVRTVRLCHVGCKLGAEKQDVKTFTSESIHSRSTSTGLKETVAEEKNQDGSDSSDICFVSF